VLLIKGCGCVRINHHMDGGCIDGLRWTHMRLRLAFERLL
jgi:hypothetical protein